LRLCGRGRLLEAHLPEIVDRLNAAGKEVVRSTLALVTSAREMNAIKANIGHEQLIEANDVASLQSLKGSPHVIGPFINVFNETTCDFLVRNGAKRIVLAVEASAAAIGIIAAKASAIETEVMVFGRQPLSVAMRCYHARSHGLTRDSCQFVCGLDADGLPADTIDGQPILTVNGTQTMSHGYGVLLNELGRLQRMGVSHFRLSPQDVDMVQVAALYRAVLDKKSTATEALGKLKTLTAEVPFINGFIHGCEGLSWVEH
jgi:collagenase-like PrtC family protease